MKKLLEAIPNSLIVVGAIAAVGLLLSPFLLEMFSGRPKTGGVTLQEDSESLPGLAEPRTNRTRTSQPMQLIPQAELLNHYAGLTLDTPLAKVQEAFLLRPVGRVDAIPQLFETRNAPQIDYLRVTFYDNRLKEFLVVYPARPAIPEDLADELFRVFGEVPSWLRGREDETARIGAVTPDLIEQLMAYPHAQQFAWSDGANRVDATVYSRIDADNQSQCILAVQVSAAKWLKDRKAKQESGVAASLPEKPETGGATEPAPTR